MQLFVLDSDPELCAQYLNDCHVKSMCADWARALSAWNELDPVSDWAWSTADNYAWLRELLFWTNMEYRWRFRRGNHRLADELLSGPRPRIEAEGFTVPPIMVPRRYFDEDPVTACRRYYYARKRSQSQWSKRPTPWFMRQRLQLSELAA